MPLAITGVGLVGPLGRTREQFWTGVVDGATGVTERPYSLGSASGTTYMGRIPENAGGWSRPDDLDDWQPPAAFLIALAACREALDHAELTATDLPPERTGLFIGSCSGGWSEHDPLIEGLSRPTDRASAPPVMMQSLVDSLGRTLGISGPRMMVSTACAAGAHAIGPAYEYILSGDGDVALCGGVDEFLDFTIGAFASIGALCRSHCAPYSRSNGMNLGEGGAVLLLEREDAAAARGQPILARLLGYGFSADSHHPVAPDPSARGVILAVKRALGRGRLEPSDVDFVNGHGTATPANDAMERAMLKHVFGPSGVAVSSLKAATGHAFGGSAAMELAVTTLAIERQVLVPTAKAGTDDADSATDLDHITTARPGTIAAALSTSYGFGGTNAAIALGSPHTSGPSPVVVAAEPVAITGIGAAGRPGLGKDEWWNRIAAAEVSMDIVKLDTGGDDQRLLAGQFPSVEPSVYSSKKAWRRMDDMARQAVVATALALSDASCEDFKGADDVGLLVATDFGNMETAIDFAREMRRGSKEWNPTDVSNSVMSAAAGHVGIVNDWRGDSCTFMAGWTSSIAALAFAQRLLAKGDLRAIVVVASDALGPNGLRNVHYRGDLTHDAVRPFCTNATGTALAASAVALVVERVSDAKAAGRKAQGLLLGSAILGDPLCSWQAPDNPTVWARVVDLAMRRAGVDPLDLGVVVAAASGIPAMDRAEAIALSDVIGPGTPVTAPKGVIGACRGVDGAAGLLVGLGALGNGAVPPIANLTSPIPEAAPLDLVIDEPVAPVGRSGLVSRASPGGDYAALVFGSAATST